MEASAIHAPARLGRASTAGPLLRLRSDDQLVALFRMGYDDAFRVIHDRYQRRLLAYTRQMLGGSRSDAEDALQDVFLRAYGALRHDDRPVTLRAWLYRVAHNRCIDQLRRPDPQAAEVFELTRPPLQDPVTEAERREELRRLIQDVQRLPEQQRSALLMRELEGLSYAELTDALGVSLGAVKSLLVRARHGLVEATDARDAACVEIRTELAGALDRGVRSSGHARRHMRDCGDCRDYQRALRVARHGFGALAPSAGPLATLAKLLGFGGSGAGAAATAGASGSAAIVGGGAATVTATKVVAVVCCAAVVGGGAVEVRKHVDHPVRAPAPAVADPAPRAPARAHAVTAATSVGAQSTRPVENPRRRAAPMVPAVPPTGVMTEQAATPEEIQTGGAMAPDEEAVGGAHSSAELPADATGVTAPTSDAAPGSATVANAGASGAVSSDEDDAADSTPTGAVAREAQAPQP